MSKQKAAKVPVSQFPIVIPLQNLNCTHCRLLKDCSNRLYSATGIKATPAEYYCVFIWQNYSPEVVC